jgi:uncharacterized protein (DUF1778 family)
LSGRREDEVMTTRTRTDRIEARVSPSTAERIRYAAALTGESMSAFVVDAAAERAERVISEQRQTVVPDEFFEQMLAALDEPPSPAPALERAAKKARKSVTRR